MSDSTETPGLAEAREALALLERPDAVDDRGDPIIELDIVIAQEMVRRNARVYLRAAFEEVDRLTADLAAAAGELRVPIPTPGTDAARLLLANVAMRRERDNAKEHAARMERYYTGEHQAGVNAAMERMAADATKAEQERDTALADLSALRIEHEAVRGLLTHTRRERDEARDETSRMWDATEADRARMAELEARPTYEAGVYAAIDVMEAAAVDSPDSVFFAVTAIQPRILALLEPKP